MIRAISSSFYLPAFFLVFNIKNEAAPKEINIPVHWTTLEEDGKTVRYYLSKLSVLPAQLTSISFETVSDKNLVAWHRRLIYRLLPGLIYLPEQKHILDAGRGTVVKTGFMFVPGGVAESAEQYIEQWQV